MRRSFNTSNSFLDLLFNINLCFFILFMLAMFLINPPTTPKKGDIELKAEVMITVEWEKGNADDVDLWAKGPSNEVVFYGNPNISSMSLDRDDRGMRHDMVKLEDGSIHVIEDNWEHIFIRKAIPGEYVVNVVMFAKLDRKPSLVKVKVEKLNPYRLIYQADVLLKRQNQEVTVVRFKLNKNGDVISRNTNPKSLVGDIKKAAANSLREPR